MGNPPVCYICVCHCLGCSDGKISLSEFNTYMARMAPTMLRILNQKNQAPQRAPQPSSPTKRAISTVNSLEFCNEMRQECEALKKVVQTALHEQSEEIRLGKLALQRVHQLA